jgi:Flp pilus assembly protein TadG
MAEVKISRHWACERGSQLVEFALVLPLLLLVVLAIADFGFIFQRFEVVTNAAREGARVAVLPGYTVADVEARVIAYADAGGAPGLTAAAIDVDDTTVAMGAATPLPCKRVTINYTYTYQFMGGIAGLFGASYTTVPLRAVAEMRTESAGT